jgi:ribosomal protein L29
MTLKSAIIELLKMSQEDLHREAKGKRAGIGRKRLYLELKKDKDSAAYRREKKELARILTVANMKKAEALQKKPSSPKVSAPSGAPERRSSTKKAA